MKRYFFLAGLALFVNGAARSGEAWHWTLPSYVPAPPVPSDNPMSEAKFQLGRHLFYDKRLSGNGSISCASCHRQELAFTDGRRNAVGATGGTTPRNAQPLANVAWNATLTWANPALVRLESQMEIPLYGTDPLEMGVNDDNRPVILARLSRDSNYPRLFRSAFPDQPHPMSFANIIKAIACFERGLLSFQSRYDLWLQGEAKLSPSEDRGRDLFFGEKGECHHCHGSFNFNDQIAQADARSVETPFHNTGLYNLAETGAYPFPNRGVFELSGNPEDMGAFRAPSLRNVALTAPYMHDGSVSSLEEVVEIYADGGRVVRDGPYRGDGRANPHKSGLITAIDLSDQERSDLVAFLRSLTDETFITSHRFSDPWRYNKKRYAVHKLGHWRKAKASI